MLGDRCKVEHIARLETPTAIEDLFSDDFRWRFKRDGVPLNVVRSCWIWNDAVAADEINFAQIVIRKLQHTGACLIAVRSVIERSEEHPSELQSLMRISYAVFCLKKNQFYILTYTS